MPRVSLRTSFMVRKARAFSFCAAVCRSSRSCSAAHMRTSDARGLKTAPRLQEWRLLRSGPSVVGGANENDGGPGTEIVPAIAGMAAAAEWALRDRDSEQKRQQHLRDELWTRISQNVPDAKQNSANTPGLANTLNVSLLGLDS